MSDDVLMRCEKVSKKFCRDLKRSMFYGAKDAARRIFGMGVSTDKLRKNEFWALDNISFELKRGECLGVIGPNGAGKSTLLKMLNGIIFPDKGCIKTRGRVGALIQVGAGFHPNLTGRENIYVNGQILGMDKGYIDKKFDEIVDFADIGDFLDSPVKFYSSGMFVRLGFAVAANMEPDILLVDEVLAVGDVNFRSKCIRKMEEMRKRASIILISHNMFQIDSLCEDCFLLDKGKILSEGDTHKVVRDYYALNTKRNSEKWTETIVVEIVDAIQSVNVSYLDSQNKVREEFETGEDLVINFEIFSKIEINDVDIHFSIISIEGVNLISQKTGMKFGKVNIRPGKNEIFCRIKDIPLLKGGYLINFNFREKMNNRLVSGIAPQFTVTMNSEDFYDSGLIKVRAEWQVVN